jgi:hypothetical protein
MCCFVFRVCETVSSRASICYDPWRQKSELLDQQFGLREKDDGDGYDNNDGETMKVH